MYSMKHPAKVRSENRFIQDNNIRVTELHMTIGFLPQFVLNAFVSGCPCASFISHGSQIDHVVPDQHCHIRLHRGVSIFLMVEPLLRNLSAI